MMHFIIEKCGKSLQEIGYFSEVIRELDGYNYRQTNSCVYLEI